jgi:hypothetical protein
MATTNYRNIPPVGQNDNASCWAACLSWWLAANGRVRSSQNDLLVEFNNMTSDDGTVSIDSFIKIAATPRFAMQTAKFDINGIQQIRDNGALPITNAPNLIAFKKFLVGPGIIGMHMNVVFDQRGPDAGKLVTCMEPWFPEGAADGRRTGAFLDKDINEFLRSSPIVIACAN